MPGSIRSRTTRSAGWSRSSASAASPSAGLVDVVPGRAEVGDHDLAHGHVVIDHQHPRHRHPLGPSVRRLRRHERRPATAHDHQCDQHRPAEPVVPVEQGRVVRAGAEAGRARGSPSRVTGTRTPAPTTAGREPVAGQQPHGDERDQRATSGARTPSCSTTPADQPDQGRRGCWPSRGRAAATRRTPRPATPSDAAPADRTRPHHASPRAGRPTWSAARRAGPAR